MIVDSCKSPEGTEPVALEYLRTIGVDPGKSVRTIVATHWHDDHIQGLATVLRECQNAQFAMSNALSGQQFIQLVLEVDAQNKLVRCNSSASEFAEILEILESRVRGAYATGPDIYAQDGSRIFHGGHAGTTEVWALSPSAATVTNALTNLADRLSTAGECKGFKRLSPNDLSVAILVKTRSYDLLLGADLENTAAQDFGWKAVLNSKARPTTLVNQPIAVVTPYAKLIRPLPRDTDVQQIKSRTNMAYCTTWPPSRKPPRRKGVDGILRGAVKSRRALNQSSGYVRLRLDLSDSSASPTVDLFGSANQL